MNVLTTLMKADGGTVRVAGHDVATETKKVRAVIGVTGQFAAVDELLTGRANLQNGPRTPICTWLILPRAVGRPPTDDAAPRQESATGAPPEAAER